VVKFMDEDKVNVLINQMVYMFINQGALLHRCILPDLWKRNKTKTGRIRRCRMFVICKKGQIKSLLLTSFLTLMLFLTACQPGPMEVVTPTVLVVTPEAEVVPETGLTPTREVEPEIVVTPTTIPATPTTIPATPTNTPVPPTATPVVEDEPADQVFEANITDSAFQPRELTIPAGASVLWQHIGNFPHTVTADDGTFNSGTLQNGDTFRRTFSEPGRYPYYCEIHGGPGGSGMSGVIIVEGP
jgi:plastocyanin